MNISSKLAIGCTLGAILGTAAFVLNHGHATLGAAVQDVADSFPEIDGAAFVAEINREAEANRAAGKACRDQGRYWDHTKGLCGSMLHDCNVCVAPKKIRQYAVWRDIEPRAVHVKPNYSFQIAEGQRWARESEASRAATTAGLNAFNHSQRCQRLWSASDVQCEEK